jgi:predicted RNase H-like HicB family nuclease
VRIPSDLAEELGHDDDSFISHWNAGRKPVPMKSVVKLMEIATRDERLAGLKSHHLLPEKIKQVLPYVCAECPRKMKFRAMIKKNGDWWTGWLIDLPGANAQEKTREKLLESLKIGAEDMLSAAIPFEPEAQMTTIDIPTPEWGMKKST